MSRQAASGGWEQRGNEDLVEMLVELDELQEVVEGALERIAQLRFAVGVLSLRRGVGPPVRGRNA